jgi:ArsR family transcriptional regulator
MVKLLKVLADETRLRLINFLAEKERCVCEIYPIFGQSTISGHLKILKDANIVDFRKELDKTIQSRLEVVKAFSKS